MTPQEIVAEYKREPIFSYRRRMEERHDLLADELTKYITEMLRARAPKSFDQYQRRITFLPTYRRVVALHADDPYRSGVWYGINNDKDRAEARIGALLRLPVDAALDRWRTFINNLSVHLWAKRSLLVTFNAQPSNTVQPRILHPHMSAVIGDTYESDYYSTLSSATAVIVAIIENGKKGFRIWYRDRIVTTDENGVTQYEVQSNGVLPFVRVFAEPNDSDAYAPQTGEALTRTALQVAYGETELAVAIEMIDPVPLLKGWNLKDGSVIDMSPFHPLTVGVNQAVEFVGPNPAAVTERRNQLLALYARMEANYNLQPGALSSQSDSAISGVARRITTEPLRAERNSWKRIIATIDRFLLRSLGVMLRNPAEIDVYPEPERGYLDPTEDKIDTEAIDRGIASPVDIIAEREGITRERASADYARNLAERDQGKDSAPSDPFFPGV